MKDLIFTVDVIDSVGVTWNRVADLRTSASTAEKRVQVILSSSIAREGRYDLDFKVSTNPSLNLEEVEAAIATLRGFRTGTLRPL